MSKDQVSTAVAPVEIKGGALAGFREIDGSRGNYVSFPMPGKGHWDEVRIQWKNFGPFEPVLVRQKKTGNAFDRIAPNMNFRCFWLGGYHCYAQLNIGSGAVEKASLIDTGERTMIEMVEAVIVVPDTTGECVPARCSFRKALAKVALRMELARTKEVVSPDWAKAHPHTAKVPPQFRFMASITVTEKPSRRNPGQNFPDAVAVIDPITVEELRKYQECASRPEFKAELESCLTVFGERVREIEAKLPADQRG